MTFNQSEHDSESIEMIRNYNNVNTDYIRFSENLYKKQNVLSELKRLFDTNPTGDTAIKLLEDEVISSYENLNILKSKVDGLQSILSMKYTEYQMQSLTCKKIMDDINDALSLDRIAASSLPPPPLSDNNSEQMNNCMCDGKSHGHQTNTIPKQLEQVNIEMNDFSFIKDSGNSKEQEEEDFFKNKAKPPHGSFGIIPAISNISSIPYASIRTGNETAYIETNLPSIYSRTSTSCNPISDTIDINPVVYDITNNTCPSSGSSHEFENFKSEIQSQKSIFPNFSA